VATANETRSQGVVDMRVFYLNNHPDLTRDQLALESEPMTIPKLRTEPESTELLERLQRTRGRVGREDSRPVVRGRRIRSDGAHFVIGAHNGSEELKLPDERHPREAELNAVSSGVTSGCASCFPSTRT
jgi:hypothetical protein